MSNGEQLTEDLKQFNDQKQKYRAYRLNKIIGFCKFCLTEITAITAALIIVIQLFF